MTELRAAMAMLDHELCELEVTWLVLQRSGGRWRVVARFVDGASVGGEYGSLADAIARIREVAS